MKDPTDLADGIGRFDSMFRSLTLAIGITLCIFGLECMVVEKFVLASEPAAQAAAAAEQHAGQSNGADGPHEFKPPEWMPWSLVSAGAVIILYSFTIPRRVAS